MTRNRQGSCNVPHASRRAGRPPAAVCGETYAHWYLRRHGYVLVERNYCSPGIKGAIDMMGYDALVVAFCRGKNARCSRSAVSEQA